MAADRLAIAVDLYDLAEIQLDVDIHDLLWQAATLLADLAEE